MALMLLGPSVQPSALVSSSLLVPPNAHGSSAHLSARLSPIGPGPTHSAQSLPANSLAALCGGDRDCSGAGSCGAWECSPGHFAGGDPSGPASSEPAQPLTRPRCNDAPTPLPHRACALCPPRHFPALRPPHPAPPSSGRSPQTSGRAFSRGQKEDTAPLENAAALTPLPSPSLRASPRPRAPGRCGSRSRGARLLTFSAPLVESPPSCVLPPTPPFRA